MALSITHSYVSAVPDAGDASLVQPSDWNDTHDIAGLAAGVETFLGTPSSANLATAVTDETGSGALVFANTPTLVTPVLGVASATSINKVAITAPATSATLTIADGKTLTASVTMTLQGGDASVLSIAAAKTATISNTLTFSGTDGSSVAFGTGGTVLYSGGSLTATAVTVADEASDTTCFPLFATAATGDLGPKSNAEFTFNSSSGALGAKTLVLSQGTITDVATNLSGTVTWNDAADTFTGWLLNVTNTASNSASKLIDLQLAGTTVFSVTRGAVLSIIGGRIRFEANGNTDIVHFGGDHLHLNRSWALTTDKAFCWTDSSSLGGTDDTFLFRAAAKVIGLQAASSAGGTFRAIATTPATIGGNQDNYNPGGSSYFQRWSSDASRNVTGMTFTATQVDGQQHEIWNVGAQNIVLQHDVTSTAANRWQTSTGADITLAAGKMAKTTYDGTISRWRVFLCA
jgi:hypothetical protein